MANKSTISITYKFKGDSGGLKDLVKDVEKMQQAFRDGVQPAEKLKTSLVNFNEIGRAFDQIGQGVSALNGTVQGLVQAYAVQEAAETKLATVMKQRMEATDQEIQSIKDLCSAQQELGVIGDEVQLAGAQQLATFLSNRDALAELIPAMNNLVAQQKGLNATQGDAAAIANLFGKAMQGQASALRRVGISMTEAEEELIKTGTEMERAQALARIITNNVGDMNTALAATDAGKMAQLTNTLGDIKEKMGGMVKDVAPYTAIASQFVAMSANAGKAAASMRGLYTATLGANGAFKAISASAVASVLPINAAGAAARFLAMGLRMVMSACVVTAAIMALTAVIEALTGAADKNKKANEGMADSLNGVETAEKAAANARAEGTAQIERDIAATKNFNGTKQEEKKLVETLNQRYGETMGYFSSVSEWYRTLVTNSKAYCRQLENEALARSLANQIADLENKNNEITRNKDGSTRFYSKEKNIKNGYKNVDTPAGPQMVMTYTSELEQATTEWRNNVKQIQALRARLEKGASEAVAMPVNGAATAPTAVATRGAARTGGSPAALEERQKNVLEQLNDQIRANQEAVLTASAEEAEALRKSTLELVKKRDEYQALQKKLVEIESTPYTPPELETLKTYEELDAALAHYNDKLRTAQPEQRAEINATILKLRELRDGWDSALNPLPAALPGTSEETEAFNRKSASSEEMFKSGWGNMKGTVNGLASIKSALEGGGTAWDKFAASMDGALQIFEGLKGVIQLVKTLSAVLNAATTAQNMQTAATTAGAGAELAAGTQKLAMSSAVTTANVAEAASGAMKAHSSIPFVGIALGLAAVGAIIAAMASLPKFAAGGIAYGPTLGLFGEYAGASRNPEVVAPLDRLQSMLDTGEGGGHLTCSISMDKIEFYLQRRSRRRRRM